MTRRKVTEPDSSALAVIDNQVDGQVLLEAESSDLRHLSIRQQNAIDLIIQGKTDGEVGKAVGVTRQTVNYWRRWHPEFRASLERRREAVWSASVDRMRLLLLKSVMRLDRDLHTDDGWKVALALVKECGIGAHVRPTGHLEAGEVVAEEARSITDIFLSMPSDRALETAVGSLQTRLEMASGEAENAALETDSGPDSCH